MRISDWSSDVCSSDLEVQDELIVEPRVGDRGAADDNAPDAGQKQGIDLLRRPESPRNLQLLRRGAGEFPKKIVLARRTGSGAVKIDDMSPFGAGAGEGDERLMGLVGVGRRLVEAPTSEERRVGTEWVRTCRYRW